MPNFIDLAGQKFGRLQALSRTRVGQRREIYWLCRCDCGAMATVMAQNLREGKTQSCGCLLRETTAVRRRVHGQSRAANGRPTAEFRAWIAMRERCNYARHRGFKNYGGRGIIVCQEWQVSFQAFFDHIGPRPSAAYSVDRIDNNRGYEPGNVRWATRKEQQANRRKTCVPV